MRRYIVVADLTPYGGAVLPIAAFWFLLPARMFADFASVVTGLKCIALNSN